MDCGELSRLGGYDKVCFFFPWIKLPLSHALLIQCLNWNYRCFLFGEANHTRATVDANVLVTYKKNANQLVILEMTFSSTFVVKE